MQEISAKIFVTMLLFAAMFVPVTSSLLPLCTASHFGVLGEADGFTSRSAYVVLMTATTLVTPSLVVVLSSLVYRRATSLLNIPHREFWLSDEQRERTLRYLVAHSTWFATILTAFLCFVHGLVVVANREQPAHLAMGPFLSGLGFFLAASAAWVALLFARFRRPS